MTTIIPDSRNKIRIVVIMSLVYMIESFLSRSPGVCPSRIDTSTAICILRGKKQRHKQIPILSKRKTTTPSMTCDPTSSKSETDPALSLCRPAPRQKVYAQPTRGENIEMLRLRQRVDRLEKAISRVASAIIFADDVALNERAAYAIGNIYLDASLTSSRSLRLLRHEVQKALLDACISVTVPENHWNIHDIIDELDK